MKQSTEIAKLAVALVAVQGELKSIPKDSENPHFRSKYTSLDKIIDTVRPILAAKGLTVIQGSPSPISDADGRITAVTLETTLLHTSGEWISNFIILPVGTVPVKDKSGNVVGAEPTAQTAGAAITYGRRYGISSLLAITTDEDDDGARASERAPQQQQRKTKPASQQQAGGKPAPTAEKKKAEDRRVSIAGVERRLGDLEEEELSTLISQAKARDEKRFAELIAAAEEVLEKKRQDLPF